MICLRVLRDCLIACFLKHTSIPVYIDEQWRKGYVSVPMYWKTIIAHIDKIVFP